MNPPDPIGALNRLLRVFYRSLATYLDDAKPWQGRDSERTRDVMALIALNNRAMARRLAEAILSQGGRIEPGQYPVEFTAANDLSLDYLICMAIDRQKRACQEVKDGAAELAVFPVLRDLAEEVLGAAEADLTTLEALVTERPARPSDVS
jgi:hypothetical protein